MKLSRVIAIAMSVAAAGSATAAHRPGYLRTFGPSPVRFLPPPSPDAPAPAPYVLPPLPRGDEVDYPRPPGYLPLPGSVLNGTSPTNPDHPDGAPSAPTGTEGPESPPTAGANQTRQIPSSPDPDDVPPAGPGLYSAPVSPGTLMPFFDQPAAQPGAIVPLGPRIQFLPAPPPERPARSSSATYTKQ